jgi:hypothetical protein
MIERIARAIVFGFLGTVVGFYAVVFIADRIYSFRHGNDPSVGGVFAFIAFVIGCPLGCTFGAIFGFRKRDPHISIPEND